MKFTFESEKYEEGEIIHFFRRLGYMIKETKVIVRSCQTNKLIAHAARRTLLT